MNTATHRPAKLSPLRASWRRIRRDWTRRKARMKAKASENNFAVEARHDGEFRASRVPVGQG